MQINNLKNALQTNNLALISAQDLEFLNKKYPYCATTQILYAKKIGSHNISELQFASIYKGNPYIFYSQFNNFEEIIPIITEDKISQTVETKELESEVLITEEIENVLMEKTEAEPTEGVESIAEVEPQEEIDTIIEESILESDDNLIEEEKSIEAVKDASAEKINFHEEAISTPITDYLDYKILETDNQTDQTSEAIIHSAENFVEFTNNPEPIKVKESHSTLRVQNDQITEPQNLIITKSFNDWLLYFKQKKDFEYREAKSKENLTAMLQHQKLTAVSGEENDIIPEAVFKQAINSISPNEDLATEALAEILEKQGKFYQAKEMYAKLSLKYPEKSAYFATKLENLTSSN
jgi:hypothetical protein